MKMRRRAGRGLRIMLGTTAVLALLSGQMRLVIADQAEAQAAPCQDLVLNFAGLPKGTLLGEQYAGSGIHISGNANEAGRPDQLIVFDSNASGTRDPFMEVDIGNLAIIPEHLNDPNGDGLVDDPNNTEEGGVQVYEFDHPRIVRSFVIVEIDHGVQASQQAFAFDGDGNLIKQVPILILPQGTVQTVQMDASGVRRLEIRYRDSAGVTNIDLGCAETPPANLVVIKEVINDNGGTASPDDFTIHVDDPGTDPADFPGQASPGTTVAVDPGAYVVTETGPIGYAASLSSDCTGTIAAGETRTCTITNNDLPPGVTPDTPPGTIVIIKDAVPNGPQDFNFTGPVGTFALDDDADPGLGNTQSFTVPSVNTYTVSETPVPGWSTTISCVADTSMTTVTISGLTATIFLGRANTVTCTFTNKNLVGALALDKTVNPGVIHAGGSVTYTYKVTNTGADVLHAVTVTDDKCSPVSGPTGDNGNGVLDLLETWTYTCTTTLSVDTTNIASVTAIDSANDSVGPVTDTASVDVINPGLSILKTSDVDSGSPGDTVTFSFKVTNTGDVTLTNISVDDDVLGHIGDIPSLAPGQSVTLTATTTLGDTDLVNVGSAESADVIGSVVQAEDKHQVDVVLGSEISQAGAGDEVQGGVLAATGMGLIRYLLFAVGLLMTGGFLGSLGRRRRGSREPDVDRG
jgi:Prealbumin-like fold domain